VNGPNTCDVYKFLRVNSELNDKKKKEVREIPWNFAKFLVDMDGNVVSYHNPRVEPLALIADIENMLGLR
jgi:glutathione peroxidase